MGEMTDGDWGVVPYPPPKHDPPIHRGKPDEPTDAEKPKPGEPPKRPPGPWPVRKVKEPKEGG